MISFDEVESLCRQADLDYGAAECHGILSGLICVAGPVDEQHRLALLYNDTDPNSIPAEDSTLWEQLHEQTLQQLSSDELGFQLLLPDDDIPLSHRTESLADWCRGFLYGISAADLKLGPELADELNEIIQDMTQISGAGYDDDEAEDINEGERAYMELAEYVRAGTMLIYAELQTPIQPSPDGATLH